MPFKNRAVQLFLWLWNAANILLLVGVFNHQSTNPEILGRYNRLYTAGIGLSLVIVVGVLLFSLLWQRRISMYLASRASFGGIGIIAACAMLIATTVLWMFSFDAYAVKLLITWNFIFLGMWIVFAIPSGETGVYQRRWRFIFLGFFAVLLVISFFSAHRVPGQQSSGDEPAWTDYAVAWSETGNIYYRLLAHREVPITPGVGYWLIPFAGWLDIFGVTLASGRLFIWLLYALACLAIAAAGYRLYDRWVGLFAGIIAASSLFMLASRIIRPEIGLPIFGALLILVYLRKRPIWGLFAGVLAVLSMEVHAAGLAYILAAGGMYFTDLFLHRQDRLRFQRFGLFVLGGLLGSVIYIFFHILVLPNPADFFTSLSSERDFLSGLNWGVFERSFDLYAGRAPVELALIGFSIVGLIVRGEENDRLLLRFLAFCVAAYFVFVPAPERYLIVFAPFAYIGTAALIRFGVARVTAEPQFTGSAIALFCLCSPFLALSLPGIAPNVLAEDEMPALVQRVRELIDPAAVVVGDINTYWWFQDYAGFYANNLEYEDAHQSLAAFGDLWTYRRLLCFSPRTRASRTSRLSSPDLCRMNSTNS